MGNVRITTTPGHFRVDLFDDAPTRRNIGYIAVSPDEAADLLGVLNLASDHLVAVSSGGRYPDTEWEFMANIDPNQMYVDEYKEVVKGDRILRAAESKRDVTPNLFRPVEGEEESHWLGQQLASFKGD